jgi:hypothetical protein
LYQLDLAEAVRRAVVEEDRRRARRKSRPTCVLHCSSSAEHLEQIYTGFGLLERQGLLTVRLKRASDYSEAVYWTPVLLVDLVTDQGRMRLGFDLQDGTGVAPPVSDAQIVFKRTFDRRVIEALAEGERVFPLGLNYGVLHSAGYGVRRAIWARSPSAMATGLVRRSNWLSFLTRAQLSTSTCSPERFEGLPMLDADPRVLFMARVWDPDRVPADGRRQQRLAMNESRAACVRQLRNAFGNRFVGGLEHTPYAVEKYGDCLVPDPRVTHKARYLSLVHASSICVATAGLEGSVGWKLAEYVAASKAIVTEPLGVELPGEFAAPSNYFQFTTADECVERVGTLMDSPGVRLAMMRNNLAYYHGFVRPDALVWNTITTSLVDAATHSAF